MQVKRLLMAALLSFGVACTSSTEGGTTGNTELNLDIVNPGGTSGELGFSIDRVDYRITCAGNPPGTYPIPPADTNGDDYQYNDSVDISGAFEVVDTRVPPVWQAVMDLPPGNCTVTLSVWEEDEIVCVGSQTLAIAEDETTKYDIVLVCSLSIDTPDGMADVDGTFEFITGNVCPKVYVLNALEFAPFTAPGFESGAEIQYRAKDPDNSCGNNCDPQSCTTDNPPVCTPYPSNIQDPNCNPAAGGDPNSAACLAGDHAGLVCTIAAFPLALPLGALGGTFISPADGTTPVGPVLSVNLNTASGVPGVILPGLGGPAGTGAEDSPAYPGLPNVNGSLPPLIYQCDPTLPGPVIISLVCSDGDLECNQQKEVRITCSVPDWCISDPVDCSSSGECLTDGVCDFTCDPNTSCDRCVGQDEPQPAGRPCTEGGGNVCDGAGTCVECLDGENSGTPTTNPNCDSTPVDCLLPSVCSGNVCQPREVAPDGTPCSNGECVGGVCTFAVLDPDPQSKTITVGCTNNVTADISILPYTLTVDPDPILSGQAVNVTYDGVAEFAEVFLDGAQPAVPGGVTEANLVDLRVTTQVRSGGTFPNVTLTNEPIPYECIYSGGPCDPANDLASIPGARGNSDCVPTANFNPCGQIVSVPISSDCAPGGACDTLGKLSQCSLNGFCVTGGIAIPLEAQASSGTAGASGQILFGWFDDPAECPFPAGSLCTLPPASFSSGTCAAGGDLSCLQTGELGIRVNASGLSVALECNQASDDGADGAAKSPDSALIPFNIQVP